MLVASVGRRHQYLEFCKTSATLAGTYGGGDRSNASREPAGSSCGAILARNGGCKNSQELRIVSDELWQRAQATRAAVRTAVAPKVAWGEGRLASSIDRSLFRICQVPHLRRSHDECLGRERQPAVRLSPVLE